MVATLQSRKSLTRAVRMALLSAGLVLLAPATVRAQDITLNLIGVELEAAVRTIAQATGREVVIDPRLKGIVTLQFDRPLSRARAWEAIQAQLRVAGYSMLEMNGVWRVLPDTEAKLQGGPVGANGNVAGSADQIITQVFRLQYEQAANVLNVVRPLVAPNNVVTVTPGTNSLVVTDYAANVRRISRIIAALDAPQAGELEIIALQHATAADLAVLVQRLLDQTSTTPGAVNNANGNISVAAEPRSNSLIVRTSGGARVSTVRELVAKLDQPTAGSGNIHVVYLKNADAIKLAQTLRSAYAGGADPVASANVSLAPSSVGSTSGGTAPLRPLAPVAASTSASAGSGGISIQAEPATNSLLIFAPEPVYRQLRQVIDKLDARRAQVYVESLIVEVSADRTEELGIQWQSLLGRNGNQNIGVAGTNFSTGGNNALNLANSINSGTVTTLPGAGFNLGLIHKFSGIYSLGLLARFFEQSGGANILSTPNLLTLDNEEARIVIGQNVPFLTGQYAQTGNAASVTPFQTIERRDVGLTLRVKPQISEGGTIKLIVFQESSSVVVDGASTSGPTTNKRSIESTVLVEDGQTIALGGLLQDSANAAEEKVPGLGNLPGVGQLFRYDTRRRQKTNLMVFLRPVVLRTPEAADALTQDRYRTIRDQQSVPDVRNRGGVALPETPAPQGQTLFPAAPGK